MSEALNKLIEIEKDAIEFGFEWPNEKAILQQAISECTEIQEAIENNESSDRIQEEIGDLLHAAISLCIFAGFDPEQTLNNLVKKFKTRMDNLKLVTKERKLLTLKGQSTEFMLELWDEAKNLDQKIQ